MTHPQTYALATLLHNADLHRDYEPAAVAIGELFADWPDAKKADLYALIAQRVKPRCTVVELVDTVSFCLYSNMRKFA